MIYQFETGFYEGKYFLYIHRKLTKKKFLKRSKVVKNTYAERLILMIYDFLNSELVDLRREYKKFYSMEYDNFKIFLERKLNIPISMILELEDYEKRHPQLKLYRKEWGTYGNHNIGTFILSNEMKERIEKILTMEDC